LDIGITGCFALRFCSTVSAVKVFEDKHESALVMPIPPLEYGERQ